MKVSVLMNCFNGSKYLADALNSVLKQSYKNWEINFWDNNSQDNSSDIVNSINDNRIKYFKSKITTDLGYARANENEFKSLEDQIECLKKEGCSLIFSELINSSVDFSLS